MQKMAKGSFLPCLIAITLLVFVKSTVSKKEGDTGFYELKRGVVSAKFTKYGASIVSLNLPDKYGNLADVVLGYDTSKQYKNNTPHLGATVGRVANRIGNAHFTLNGTVYKLIPNDGNNTLHGGPKGISEVVWTVKKYHNKGDSPYITFSYHSRDGEEGFPGALDIETTYRLVKEGLTVTMKAKALNKATPVNLANHAYWNLGGHNSGDILSSEVQIFASQITPVDKTLIPTGKLTPVKNTPFDFLKPTIIKEKISSVPNGYDINYAVDGDYNEMKKVAVVYDKKSGRVMKLFANQPGVQFYSANFLSNVKGKGGFFYQAHAALCLETQGYPDSVNHPNFPSQIVNPGETYVHVMVFKFSTKSRKSYVY